MSGLDFTPLLPAEDGGSVDEEDASHLRFEGGVEKCGEALIEALVPALPGDVGGDFGAEVDFDGLEHLEEELFPVGEVAVEGAAGSDSGGLDDVVRAGGVEAILGEEPTGGRDDPLAGLLRHLLPHADHPRNGTAGSGSHLRMQPAPEM